jgi:Gas vesicle synthesis protein GvpL/GvpF
MTASVTPESTSGTTEAYYVYGIVRSDAPVEVVAEAGMGDQVELHTDGSVGALVEAIDIDRPLGRRRDLVAHSTVLNTMAAHGPVLPMRFGAVVEGERAVVEELLAPQQEHFRELLEQVAGRVQFTLRAHYVLDTVLAEVVAAEPEIAQLRRETADLPEDATHFKRIRLGELVSKAVDARRRTDAEDLIARISQVVEDWVAREVAGMDTMADFALLVASDKQAELEAAAEVLAEELDGRVRLSLAGPMALFDFVPEQ